VALTAGAAHAQAPQAAAQCMSCHGSLDPPKDPAVPIIAGQRYEYLVSALTAYRNKDRDGDSAAVMQQIAAALTMDELRTAAQFYSQLRSVRW
jgi:cytochrome c553